jgi:hypothetical protein
MCRSFVTRKILIPPIHSVAADLRAGADNPVRAEPQNRFKISQLCAQTAHNADALGREEVQGCKIMSGR